MAARNEAACACLEIWVNTEADQETIDAGLHPKSAAEIPLLWVDDTGYYHVVYPEPPGFQWWIWEYNIGYVEILIALNEGLGCPYSQTP